MDHNVFEFPVKVDFTVSLSELVGTADRVPPSRVLASLADKMRRLSNSPPDELIKPQQLREFVVVATLINRLLFDISKIPQDPSFLL